MIDPVTAGLLVQGGSQLLGGILGSSSQSAAAKKAAKIQAAAEAENQKLFQSTYDQQRQDNSSYMTAGQTALSSLSSGLQSGGDLSTEYGKTFDDYWSGDNISEYLDPSSKYQQQQMREALEESASAAGDLNSGAFAKELQDRSASLAQTDYANSWNRMNTSKQQAYQRFSDDLANFNDRQTNRYNMLSGVSNMGLTATSNVGNYASNYASNTANSRSNAAQAQAAGVMGAANANSSLYSSVGNTVGNLAKYAGYNAADNAQQALQVGG